jgi:hypothetical protein
MRGRVILGTLILGALLGIVLPRLLEPSEAGAGVTVIGGTTTLPAGGGTGSGNITAPDGGVKARTIMVSADDAGAQLASTTVEIDVSGNISVASGATVGGRDLTDDGTKIDGLPLEVLSAGAVSPGDAGFVAGTYYGTGATYNADAGYVVPACRVALPLRTGCRFRVRWHGVSVVGTDASSDSVTVGSFCRIYIARTNTTGITPVDAGLPAYVSNCETDIGSLTAGVMMQSDGSVAEPTVQGVAATHIRWTCTVDDIVCAYNP